MSGRGDRRGVLRGHAAGAFVRVSIRLICVIDTVPHVLPDAQKILIFRMLAQGVVAALEGAPAAPAVSAPPAASSAFLTLVGHELRMPLTVMRAALKLIEARMEDPVQGRLAQSALRSTEHL